MAPTHDLSSPAGDDGSSGSSVLSTLASIDIGIGVGVGALFVIAGLVFWFFRRRQTQKTASNPPYQSVHPEPSELGSQTVPSSTPAQTTMSEMDGQGRRPLHELA